MSFIECIDGHQSTFEASVLFWCLLPVLVATVNLLVGCTRAYQRHLKWMHLQKSNTSSNIKEVGANDGALKDEVESSDVIEELSDVNNRVAGLIKEWKIKDIVNDTCWYYFFTSYLIIPIVLNKLFSTLDCVELESGDRYIRQNTSVSCASTKYNDAKVLVLVFSFLYMSTPLVWCVLIFRHRHVFHSKNSTIKGKERDEKHVMYLCDNNPNISMLRFLFEDFKSDMWYFESVDLYRRILFIAVLPLLSTHYSIRASFGCLLALICIYIMREIQPYREEFANTLAYVSQFVVFITYHAALSVETSSQMNFLFSGENLGVWLIVVNTFPTFMALWWATVSCNREHNCRLKRLLKAIERKLSICLFSGF
jgi:hypothetical protein